MSLINKPIEINTNNVCQTLYALLYEYSIIRTKMYSCIVVCNYQSIINAYLHQVGSGLNNIIRYTNLSLKNLNLIY